MCPKSYNYSVTAVTFQKHYNLYGKCLYLAYEMIMKLLRQYLPLRLCKKEHLLNHAMYIGDIPHLLHLIS